MKRWSGIIIALSVLLSLWIVAVLYRSREAQFLTVEARISSIMGTQTVLKAVVPARDGERGRRALRAAEEALRAADARMSVWVGSTEISRFNAAAPGRTVPLSQETLEVLHLARDFSEVSRGAFDVTCRPLIELWQEAGRWNREPSQGEIGRALALTGWRWIRLHDRGGEKLKEGVGIDLGGIAKGFAVERAASAMKEFGLAGGMVQCGGDIRVFGRSEPGQRWRLGIRNPFSDETESFLGILEVTDAAVSTSGNYERFVVIQGRRRSHIVDPRSGMPLDAVPQVTVTAPSAAVSDGWSTALTVLGRDGLELVPTGVEAMIIVGNRESHQVFKTAGFDRLIASGR